MQTATSDLLRTTHSTGPGQRKLLPLADNAFRLLGLSCHATQQEIYASAASIRRAIKLGVDRTPPHHLSWLGSFERTENSVRDALSRLADPAQRIYERFYWFFNPQLVGTELSLPALKESVERLREAAQPATGHDIALLSLAVILQLDPKLFNADEWQRTYALWKELIEAKEFWSLLVAADLKGDFEQVTTFGEVRNLRARAWRLVTSPVAEIAKDGILRDDPPLTRRALAILRRSDLPQMLADEYENDILAPVEDKFEVLLAEAFRTYRYYVKSNQSVAERRETCYRTLAKFDEEVKPALKKIFEMAGALSLVTRRVCEQAADALDELADGFDSAFEPAARLKTLRRAWQLASPESATLLLIEEHLKAAGDQQERKEKTDSDYAHQLHLALVREPVAPPELFTSYMQKVDAAKKSEGCIGLLSKVVLGLLLVVFVGKCFNSLPGSRRYNNLPPPMNFNVAMPRFTPSPMPELQLKNLVFHIPPGMLEVGMILKSTVVVDVRAKNEYDAGHIAGAISIPAGEIAARAKRLPKSKRIVCYDDMSGLAERAALELQTLGFTEVAVLEGGYQAWLDAKLPVERQKASTRRSERQVVNVTRDPQ
jgi:rhodanese-related sulfurtransferase